jgi:hypothetical protein
MGGQGAAGDTSNMGAQRSQTEPGRRNAGVSAPGAIVFTPERVAQLQSALNDAGCDAGKPDGVVGPRTRRALACARQKNNVTTNQELYQSLNFTPSPGAAPSQQGQQGNPPGVVSSPPPSSASPGAATDTAGAQATQGDSSQVGGQNRGRVRPPGDSLHHTVPGNPPPSSATPPSNTNPPSSGTTPPPSGTNPSDSSSSPRPPAR